MKFFKKSLAVAAIAGVAATNAVAEALTVDTTDLVGTVKNAGASMTTVLLAIAGFAILFAFLKKR